MRLLRNSIRFGVGAAAVQLHSELAHAPGPSPYPPVGFEDQLAFALDLSLR
jgi:hypothetical protein